MHQLTSFYYLRRSVYMSLFLMNQARQAVIAASPRVSRTRMEIREQDFSFHDDARERPLIEVVTKDVRTSDIFNIMEAIGRKEEIAGEEPASWWMDKATEEFSRQDVVLSALIAFCALRLLVFTVQVTFQLLKLPIQWYKALKDKVDREVKVVSVDTSFGNSRQQLATIRFCHRQLVSVVEKVKSEMRQGQIDDAQQIVASLVCTYTNKKTVTLAEVLTMLHKINANDSTFTVSDVGEHLTDTKDDGKDDEALDVEISDARAQLQEIYALFLRLQTVIIRRKVQQQQCGHTQQESGRHPRQLLSCSDPTNEVSRNLKELTKELPQGFTADMFTSLGNAMHKSVAPSPAERPETMPTPQLDTMRASIARTSVRARAKQNFTVQQAA